MASEVTVSAPVGPSRSDEGFENELRLLRSSLAALEAKFAEAKPVQEVVKLLLYFWAAISVVLGIFGWKQFSDIETMVTKQVQLTLPSDKAKYAEYDRLIGETKLLYGDFQKLTATYRERVKDLDFAGTVSKEFDIEGQIQKVIDTVDEDNNVRDQAWRTRAIFTLTTFREAMKTRAFSANLVFNTAQVCRQLEQYQLARELTEAAYKMDPTPANHAMFLASKVADIGEEEREKAFVELMGLVTKLTLDNPHIVLAEAWNAAETQSKYQRFLDALSQLIKDRGNDLSPDRYVPSYAYLIGAETHLRQGIPGSKAKARELLERGLARLRDESPHSKWFEAAIRQEKSVEMHLENAELLDAALSAIKARRASS